MESLTFNQFISLIIVFVSWILVVFLLTAKTKNKLSNILLSLFLIVNAQDSSGMFASYFIYPTHPGWGMFINSTVFLKMPLLYLYFQSVIYSDFKLQKKQLLHLIPFVLNLIAFIPGYYLLDFDAKWEFLESVNRNKSFEIRFSYITVHIQILVYLIMSYRLVNKYKILLLENYSNANLLNFKWLFSLITIFSIETIIATLKNIFLFAETSTAYAYSVRLTGLLVLFFICWMVLKALHNPELFRGVNSNLQLVKYLVLEEMQSPVEMDHESKEIEEIVRLKKYMIEKEPFLNDSLTINDLSNQMNMPVKQLSLLINRSLNQHFFDFVNSYRIKKAMDMLTDPTKKSLTILEILYEVGFNSKSSFNTAFKNYTQMTPTEYRSKSLI